MFSAVELRRGAPELEVGPCLVMLAPEGPFMRESFDTAAMKVYYMARRPDCGISL